MIDWKTKAKQQQEDYLNDLISLMKIQSVRDDTQATDEFPLGPKPAQALTIFWKWHNKTVLGPEISIMWSAMLNGVRVKKRSPF